MEAFLLLILFAAALWLVPYFWRRWRKQHLMAQPLSAEQQSWLEEKLALYPRLPPDQQRELNRNISLFLREKEFVGCNGLKITEEMRVTVAAHACLLLLQRANNCYPNLRTILLYPDAYIAEETHREGYVESAHLSARAGEAHYRGPVVLSWADLEQGLAQPHQGHNVAIHEFAHKLDEEDGYVDGRPLFDSAEAGKDWAPVMREAFNALRQRLHALHTEINCEETQSDEGEGQKETPRAEKDAPPSVLDTYGAQSPAEFFAVATEAYFVIPTAMQAAHPALYRELQKFYRTDPAALLRGNLPGD